MEVIKEVKSGSSQNEAASARGVSRKQVQNIIKNQEAITEHTKNQTLPLKAKLIVQKAYYAEVEKAVFQWFKLVRNPLGRCKPLPVSRSIIQARAKLEATKRNIANFKASDGWFARWRNRFNVGHSVNLFGEASDVDLEEAEKKMEDLRRELLKKGYEMAHIFDMDEAPLFFRAMPTRTYEYVAEHKR